MLVDLADPAAQREGMVGAKVARLAKARQLGAPVPAGFAVPREVGRQAVEAALPVARTDGLHAAQLELLSQSPPPSLVAELGRWSQALGQSLVVRSSASVEDDPSWAGAFSSFIDVHPEEVPTAVLGCWAATFHPGVAARSGLGPIPDPDLCPAVLVQPCVEAIVSGVARHDPDGTVVIDAVAGAPAPLLAGWVPGSSAVISANGDATGPALDRFGSSLLEAVAQLARGVAMEGPTSIEWASTDRGMVLLQVAPTAPLAVASPRPSRPRRTSSELPRPVALRMARLVTHFAGHLGEAMVLPWAAGAPSLRTGRLPTVRPGLPAGLAAWDEARALAATLTASAWGTDGTEVAGRALDGLAVDPSKATLRCFARLPPADPALVTRLLSTLATVDASLRERGILGLSGSLWSLDPEDLPGLLTGSTPQARPGLPPRPTIRWQRFLQATMLSAGTSHRGGAASPGEAVGLARFCSSADSPLLPGEIVVLSLPLPHFAPLLWRAGGLVSLGGSAGAHLVEVARSRRVPAVVRLENGQPERFLSGKLVYLDGGSGELLVA